MKTPSNCWSAIISSKHTKYGKHSGLTFAFTPSFPSEGPRCHLQPHKPLLNHLYWRRIADPFPRLLTPPHPSTALFLACLHFSTPQMPYSLLAYITRPLTRLIPCLHYSTPQLPLSLLAHNTALLNYHTDILPTLLYYSTPQLPYSFLTSYDTMHHSILYCIIPIYSLHQ